MEFTSSIGEVKGIGKKTAQLFQKLGVYTVGDILLHYPRDYDKMPEIRTVDLLCQEEIKDGMVVALIGKVEKIPLVRNTGKVQVTSLTLKGTTQSISLVWFRMPYLKNTLKLGTTHCFFGKLSKKGRQVTMEQPQILELEKYKFMENRLWPCYPLTKGLTKNMVLKVVRQVLEIPNLCQEYLPEDLRARQGLAEYSYSMENIHFPGSKEDLEQARRRLVFDEFFQFLLAAQMQKAKLEKVKNEFYFLPIDENDSVEVVMKNLPFSLTGAQQKTLQEIRENMRGNFIMQRLIQGDVGSGKTIVAFLSMLDCSVNGYQSALMAPTEVLAKQHYETFCKMCEKFQLKIPVILLTGSMTQKEKRKAYDRIQLYSKAMVIGTHALIQEQTVFDNLALVITDEQHRFGVKQRETLYLKGSQPHILVMSATPIPRTLALILYGDLDISIIDQVPAKRLPIKNCVVSTKFRPKTYEFIRNELAKGHQAYVICALVEESEGLEAENVIDYSQKVQQELPEYQVVCLHGKMKGSIKNQIMEDFAAGKSQVLVSTTVIEVGINVPNATVILIEDAQRFGLAQLHQLRGRVGRGDAQSYCIMINTSDAEKAKQRLEILNQSNDGFFIASEDLKLRGPGDFFGIRQSGLMEFSLGDIYGDSDILKAASMEVKKIFQDDPTMESTIYQKIKGKVREYLHNTMVQL